MKYDNPYPILTNILLAISLPIGLQKWPIQQFGDPYDIAFWGPIQYSHRYDTGCIVPYRPKSDIN